MKKVLLTSMVLFFMASGIVFAAGECVGAREPSWSNLFAVLTHDDHLLQFAPMFVQTAALRRFRRRRPTYWSGD